MSLRDEYEEVGRAASEALTTIIECLTNLAGELGIPLTQPVTGRVKTWNSIETKLKRLTQLKIASLKELDDLVAARAVFLFPSDVAAFGSALTEKFEIQSRRLSVERHDIDQFGYASDHFIMSVPRAFRVEVQVRTLAQHVWAEASHCLYYKSENMVPRELQRSIHRASAVLEVVDFELERLRKERDEYLKRHKWFPGFDDDDEGLSMMGVQIVLHEMLPKDHFVENDHYFGLMTELLHLDFKTLGQLRELIRDNLDFALQEEKDCMAIKLNDPKVDQRTKDRLRETGQYCSHVALVRTMLIHKFGKQYRVFDPSKWKKS